jgi:hypothetical protein
MTIEPVRTSETSVCLSKTTRLYDKEICHLHTRGSENQKSYKSIFVNHTFRESAYKVLNLNCVDRGIKYLSLSVPT